MKLSFLLLILLFSCKQHPFPTGGELLSGIPTIVPQPVEFGTDLKVIMDFTEGSEGLYKVNFTVPKGDPDPRPEKLPAGAKFYKEDGAWLLEWKPDFKAANDPNDPMVKQKDYQVFIHLWSTDNNVDAKRYEAILRVEDRRLKYSTDLPSSTQTVYEGSVKDIDFTVTNEDYQSEKHEVYIVDNYPWLSLKNYGNNGFGLVVKPDHLTVMRKISGSSKKFPVTVKIVAVDGRVLTEKIDITIYDRRLEPSVQFPKGLVGEQFSVNISVTDLNGEESPRVTIYNEPEFGEFSFQKVFSSTDNGEQKYPMDIYTLNWRFIPLDYMGQTYTFRLKVCVTGICRDEYLSLDLELIDEAPPTFERENYPLASIPLLLHSDLKRFRLKVTQEDGKDIAIDKLAVRPKEYLNKFVKLHRDSVEIIGYKEGFTQFSLIATSELGTQGESSFVFETLPSNWPKYLYLGQRKDSKEVNFLSKILGGINFTSGSDKIDEIDARLLMGKETLIVGTESVDSYNYQENLSAIIEKINFKNIVVSTPNIENLPEVLREEIKDDLGLNIKEKHQGTLSGYHVEPSGYSQPWKKVFLSADTSKYSKSPNYLLPEFDDDNCKYFLKLLKIGDENFEEGLGYSCKRKNGGKFVALGIEYADLIFHENDQYKVESWFKKALGL